MAIIWPEGTQNLPSKVVQVRQTLYTGVHSMSGNWSTVSGLNCAITPKSSNNRAIVICHMGILSYEANTVVIELMKNGGSFYRGNAGGSRERVSHRSDGRKSGDNNHGFGVCCVAYTHPNTTSSVTYSVRMTGEGRNRVGYVNRSKNDQNVTDPFGSRTASSMTIIEYEP
jgi:hypothetical protein